MTKSNVVRSIFLFFCVVCIKTEIKAGENIDDLAVALEGGWEVITKQMNDVICIREPPSPKYPYCSFFILTSSILFITIVCK